MRDNFFHNLYVWFLWRNSLINLWCRHLRHLSFQWGNKKKNSPNVYEIGQRFSACLNNGFNFVHILFFFFLYFNLSPILVSQPTTPINASNFYLISNLFVCFCLLTLFHEICCYFGANFLFTTRPLPGLRFKCKSFEKLNFP